MQYSDHNDAECQRETDISVSFGSLSLSGDNSWYVYSPDGCTRLHCFRLDVVLSRL